MSSFADLWDYRCRVSELYRGLRQGHASGAAAAEVCRQFRDGRDALFRTHPQSALDEAQRRAFRGLAYFGYDPALRYLVPIETDVEPEVLEFQLSADGLVRARRFGRVRFTTNGQACALSLFWLLGYGGGVFLPFQDATGGQESYGGGRYLLDTIKHADLGRVDDRIVIDFNYAYNPSCAYNPRWVCPPSPQENRLSVQIRAGEMAFHG
jgi:uncharacterized protein (DUF1684 family)